MESPTPVSRYIPQNSKKRVFPAGSSSSGCKEVEVLEASPPINRTSKPKSSNQKEVIIHEIIDVDMEEDSDDIMLSDREVETSAKGKEPLSYSSLGFNSLANDESGSDILMSNNGAAGLHDSINGDDLSSNIFYGEDEWIDTYYDDILYDDYATLESHFDHMDIPPGVEAPFPWLPSCPGNDSKAPATGTSTNLRLQLQSDGVNLSPGLNSSQSSCALTPDEMKDLTTTWSNSMAAIQKKIGNQHMKGKLPSNWFEPGLDQTKLATNNTSNLSPQPSRGSMCKAGKELLHSFGKSRRKPRSSHAVSSSQNNQFPPPTYLGTVSGGGSYPTLKMPTTAPGGYMPVWQDLPLNMLEPALGPTGFVHGSTFSSWGQDPANNQDGASSVATSLPTKVEQRNVDEILQHFDLFKKFDTVEDYSDHHYSKNGSSAKQPPKNWAKRIQEEWKILENDLPDKIFVRVYEARMDLLRAVIIGAEGTPYHDGLFFFDVFFPSSYPNVPPHVHYHSGGLRINPNLYNCGKVCLSLLNTWSGSHKEKWIPGVSTMLQVLVSIQGLILNAKPYFNEPGYANLSGSISGEKKSLEYNERTYIYSLQTMVYNMRRPPKYFEDFVLGHFCKHSRDILVSCKAYLDGAQVGCLAKGGVQDVDEGDKSCSQQFKNKLAEFITILVNTFLEIGAKDCQEFLSLAQKETGQATTVPRPMNLL
ncbi:probable ubiquitin-conjugating enzyme E2 26 [Sesamum indicum]|uniref:E2 ubiquitin-conjugating enzyme n=1 Tax=Sesamum indicum TaxID=4182 RepID=A0A6I9UJV8_SESIN|nr:probable ubiquitin-conjugating enzyme E2 26 [Sesamum indicum]